MYEGMGGECEGMGGVYEGMEGGREVERERERGGMRVRGKDGGRGE